MGTLKMDNVMLHPTATREKVARFIECQFIEDDCSREKGGQWHYGLQDLRELMDFIYNSEPLNDKELLNCKQQSR